MQLADDDSTSIPSLEEEEEEEEERKLLLFLHRYALGKRENYEIASPKMERAR